MRPAIRYFSEAEDFAATATTLFCDTAKESIAARGAFHVAFSGGRTPVGLWKNLAALTDPTILPWNKIHIFWSDERDLPPEHPKSNQGQALQILKSSPQFHQASVHPMVKTAGHPEKSAAEYEQLIRRIVPANQAGGIPVFDLLLLGLGADGHVASLFPGSSLLQEKNCLVVATPEPCGNPEVRRVSMTLPLINQAKTVLMLVAGEEKKETLDRVFENSIQGRLPASLICPNGRLLWFVLKETFPTKDKRLR